MCANRSALGVESGKHCPGVVPHDSGAVSLHCGSACEATTDPNPNDSEASGCSGPCRPVGHHRRRPLPSSPTTLGPLETIHPQLPEQERHQLQIHSRYDVARRAVASAFGSSPNEVHQQRAQKLLNCCRDVAIWVTPEGKPTIAPKRCRDRLCPLCSARRAYEAGKRMTVAAESMKQARMLTLTAPHVQAPLTDQLAALRRAFAKLRKSPAWTTSVLGGIYAIECTFNAERGEWHPHMHVLMDGEYMHWADVKEAWRQALNASGGLWNLAKDAPLSVQIEFIYNRAAAAKYVAKYITKPADLERWPQERITEFADAMHGGRLMHTFGNLHGRELDPRDPNESTEKGRRVASIAWIDAAARRGQKSGRVACLLFRLIFPMQQSWVDASLEKIPDGTLREGESIPAAFVRIASAAESEFWRAIEQGHSAPKTGAERTPGRRREPPAALPFGTLPA